jgi:hypothetical protein
VARRTWGTADAVACVGAYGRIALDGEEAEMSIAKVEEISATSDKSFEDAVQQGLARAAQTLRNINRAWVKEQHVRVDNGAITEYQVNLVITFVLDD